MKRVLIVDTYSGIGGGQVATFAFVRNIGKRVDIELAMPKGSFFDAYKNAGFIVHELTEDVTTSFLQLHRLIREGNFDVVHAQGLRAGTIVRTLSFFGLICPKVFMTIHGFHHAYKSPFARLVLLRLEKVLNTTVHKVIAISATDKTLLLNTKVIDVERLILIPNGIEIRKNITEPIVQHTIDLSLCFIARFEYPKNPQPIFHAIAGLKKRGVKVTLSMIGSGTKQEEWEKIVRDFGIEDCVKWIPTINPVSERLPSFDAMVFSSFHEGLPMVVLEAVNEGIPVFTNDLPFCKELFNEVLQREFIFTDADDLTHKLYVFSKNKKKIKSILVQSREQILQAFNVHTIADQYVKLYNDTKVLHVVKLYSPWIGGVESVAQDLAEHIRGVQSSVLTCTPKGKGKREVVNGIVVNRVRSFGVKWGMPLAPYLPFAMRKMSKNIGVIDVHAPFPLADLGVLLLRKNVKVIVHYHADIVRQKLLNPLIAPLMRRTLNRADAIIVSSPNLAHTSSLLQPFQNKIHIVPFGIDVENTLEKTSFNKEKPYLLYIGRFGYYKGLLTLIEAMQGISMTLILVGDGDLKEEMVKKIEELHLQNQITILPHVSEEEKRAFMQRAYAFILPSLYRSEAFGLVLLEAMREGVPCITTELGTGTSFVNKHLETGLVVPPGDQTALHLAIKRLIENQEERNRFGKNALERVRTEFSHRQMLDKTREIFDNGGDSRRH